jgi:serine/threonine protein kinase
MAPELFKGIDSETPEKSDLYALGITFLQTALLLKHKDI